jgi:integrase
VAHDHDVGPSCVLHSAASFRQLFASSSNLRDRALFAVAYAYGLRVGEIELLDRGDVDLIPALIPLHLDRYGTRAVAVPSALFLCPNPGFLTMSRSIIGAMGSASMPA